MILWRCREILLGYIYVKTRTASSKQVPQTEGYEELVDIAQ